METFTLAYRNKYHPSSIGLTGGLVSVRRGIGFASSTA
jgi:hypothetical protein